MTDKHRAEEMINPFVGIKFIAVVAIIVAGIVIGLSYINLQRNDAMVKTYTNETNAYVSRNEKGLSLIFTTLFDESQKCALFSDAAKKSVCHEKVSQQIHGSITHDIKDYSSMFFIRMNPTTKAITMLRLSGDSTSLAPSLFKKYTPISELLSSTSDQLPWDDYFYELENNEVIVPVEIDGKRVGAIVRGVIE